ncbi:hypothetical protein [Flammeovirga aprica]|uniref:Uncharacterized protein n=1 Tax=Flammeovirga aprica JL-4 TaxID=694437 RepID=A0A7X9P3H4_9BACT|nr:hypothetical protein [Flammeovirga aprica]NME67964.1 hypothetical protein [Flammeovirga aprica JL-4]
MKSIKDYILNFIIGVFPFLALAYHLFFVHQAYKLKGLLAAAISFFTPLLSDTFWFFYTMNLNGFRLSHTIGIAGLFAGALWYYWGKDERPHQHA